MAKKGNRKKRNSKNGTPKNTVKSAPKNQRAPEHKSAATGDVTPEALIRRPLGVRIIATCLVIAAVASLGYIGVIAWGEVNRPKSIARYMPRDVRGFVEWNIDENDDETYEGKRLAQALDPAGLICGQTCEKTFANNMANEVINHDVTGKIDVVADIRPWASRRAGVAMMSDGTTVWYVEAKEEKSAVAFFTKHAAEKGMKLVEVKRDGNGNGGDISGVPVYQYEDGAGAHANTGALAQVGNYVMFGARADTLVKVINAVADNKTLATDPDYERIQNSVPRARLGFLYINDEALTAPELTIPAIKTLIMLNGRGGRTVANLRALDGRFALEYVTHYTAQARAAQQNASQQNVTQQNTTQQIPPRAYRASLAALAPKETTAFIGGADASFIAQTIRDNTALPLRDLVTTQLHTWFGNALSFDELVSLTKNEWMFARDFAGAQTDTPAIAPANTTNYTLAFAMNDPAADTAIIRRALDAAKKQRAFFQPTIAEKRLPGGAIQKRTIEGSPKTLNPVQITHRDIAIEGFEIEKEGTGAFFATLDDIAIITTTKDAMLKTIDRWKQDAPGFTNTEQYKTMIEPLTKSADSIIYIAGGTTGATIRDAINKFISPNNDTENILKTLNIGAFSFALNSFDEGIKAIMLMQPAAPPAPASTASPTAP